MVFEVIFISIAVFFILLSPYLVYINFKGNSVQKQYQCQHCGHIYSSSVVSSGGYQVDGELSVKCPKCGELTPVMPVGKKNA